MLIEKGPMKLTFCQLILSACFLFPLIVSQPVFAAVAADYYNAGATCLENHQYEKSISYFKAAISIDPNDWRSYQGLATAYNDLGNYGDAYDACEKSLEINPNNPSLRQWMEVLKPKALSPPLVPASKSSPGQKGWEGPPLDPLFWIKVSGDWAYCAEEDLNDFVNGWNVAVNSMGATNIKASGGNSAMGYRFEFGHNLDKDNGIALLFSSFTLDSFNGSGSMGASQISESIKPSVYGFELEYYRFWPHYDYRWFLKAGVGYYSVTANFSSYFGTYTWPSTPFYLNTPGQGGVLPMQNGDFGVNIGGGYELRVSHDMGLQLSGAFRYASVTELTASSIYYPNIVLGLATSPKGFIGYVNTDEIGKNGINFMTIDLTGVEFDLGLVYYIF